MERRKRKLIERVLALCLAFALMLTGVLPHAVGTVVQAAETGDGSSSGGEETTVATTVNACKEDDKNSKLTSDDVIITIKKGDDTIDPIKEGDNAGKYNLIVGKEYTYILDIKTSIDGYVDTTSTFIAEEDGEVDVVLWMKDIEIATIDSKKEIQFSSPITTETKTITLDNKYKLEVVTGEDAGIVEIAGSKGNTETTYTISNKMSGTTILAAYYYADENGEIGRKISDEISINVDNIQLEDITLSSPNKSSDSATINLGDATDCELKVVEGASEEIVDIVKSETENSWTISNQASGTTILAVYCNDKKVSNDITVIVKSDIVNPVFTITDPTNTDGNTSVPDVKVVKIEMSGLPADATGSFDLYLDGTEEKVASVTKNSNKTTINFTYNSATALTGNKTFTIKYSGDTNYESQEWKNIVGLNDLKLGQKIQFSDENNSVDTPQIAGNGAFSFSLADSSTIGNIGGITYTIDKEKSDPSIVIDDTKLSSCNGSKQATVNVTAGTGLVAIKVNITGNDTYAAAPEQTYYAYVEKTYDLSDLEDMLTIQGEKTYDGSNNVTVTATMSGDDLQKLHIKNYGSVDISKGLIFTLEGTVDSEDVKYDANNAVTEYDTITITDIKKVEGYLNNSNTKVELTKTVTGENAIQGNADELLNHIPYVDTTFTDGATLGGEGKNVSVTINPRKVYLYTNNYETEIPYGTDVQSLLSNLAGKDNNIVSAKEADNTTGIIQADKENVKANQFTVTMDNPTVYSVGTNADVLKINLNDGTDGKNTTLLSNAAYKNYSFEVSTGVENIGDLTVVQQTFSSIDEMLKHIEFSVETPQNDSTEYKLYQDKDDLSKLWLSGGVLKAKIKEDSNYSKYYDTVVLQYSVSTTNGNEEITTTVDVADLTHTGYDTELLESFVPYSGKLYLKQSTNENNYSASYDFNFTVDKTAPTFTFEDWESTVVDSDENTSWIERLFKKYTNTAFSMNVSGQDDTSGVAKWQYHIYKVDSDEKISEQALQTYVTSVNNGENGKTWKVGEISEGTVSTSIPVVEKESDVTSLGDLQGNYIVLVKITDNVGNSIVYASNGVVCEDTPPTMEIFGVETTATAIATETGTTDKITADSISGTLDSTKIYKDNIAYKVCFNDKDTNNLTSGLTSVTAKVFDGTTEITDAGATWNFEGTESEFTISQLQALAEKELVGIIPETCNSDNLSIKVTATDKAGNILAETEVQKLKIDNDAPEITVSYDNNAPSNSKYFKSARTMTIAYKERHFKEELATFAISVSDGTTTLFNDTVTLASLLDANGTKIDGITVAESETEDQTYTITFGSQDFDYDFTIEPSVTDEAGNSNAGVTYKEGTRCETAFTVDMAAPKIQVQYLEFQNESDTTGVTITDKIVTDAEEQKWYYTNKTVKAIVSITERNFANTDKTFSSELSQMAASCNMNYVNMETLETTSLEQYIQDKYITPATTGSNWQPSGQTHTQTFTFDGDANYEFDLTYTDLAGNPVSLKDTETDKFVVDKTNPTGTITIEGAKSPFKTLLEAISFGLYSNKDEGVTITFESDDITSIYNQAYFMYVPEEDIHGEVEQLQKIEGSKPSEITLGTTLKDGTDWKITDWTYAIEKGTYNRNIESQTKTTTENSQQIPYMRLEDKAGNVEFISAKGVIDDRVKEGTEEPNITITVENPTNVHERDVPFTIEVVDLVKNNTYAGLKNVSYKIIKDGDSENPTQSGTYSDLVVNETVEGDAEVKAAQRVQSIKWEGLKVDAALNNSNNVVIEVTAIDYAGNSSTKTQSVMIDTTAPNVVIAYDDAGQDESYNKYYKELRTALVTYTERNFNPTLAKFIISINREDSRSVTLQDILDDKVNGISAQLISDKVSNAENAVNATTDNKTEWTDTRTIQYQLTFGDDKLENNDNDFAIQAFVEDEAGYRSATTDLEIFTVDKVAPKIAVSYDNNKPYNSKYFDDVRTMTITYTERNFATERAIFDISVSNGTEEPIFSGKVTLASLLDPNSTKIDGITVAKSETEEQTYTIIFGKDGFDYDFTIVPSVSDKAGNSNTAVEYEDGTVCKDTFTVDMSAPNILIRYLEIQDNGTENDITEKINTSDDKEKWYYTNKTIKAVVTITERNFATGNAFVENQMKVICNTESEQDKNAITNYQNLANDVSKWTETDDNTYTQTFEFASDAVYKFNFIYQDLAQNEKSLLKDKDATYKFVVDTINPTGKIKIDGKDPEDVLPKITFEIFKKENYEISVENLEDKTSGIATVYYYETPSEVTVDDLKKLPTKEENPSATDYWTVFEVDEEGKRTFTISPNKQFIVYAKLVDKSGNVTYISTNGAVADNQAPIITVTPPQSDIIYNTDVTFSVSVEDPTIGDTYSGLEEVWYTVSASGNTELDVEKFNLVNIPEQKEQGNKTFTGTFTIPAETYNSNNVEVKIYARDFSGNPKETKTYELAFDTTAPMVQVDYDSELKPDEKYNTYYKELRTALVTYTERNFNTNLAKFIISINDEESKTVTLQDLIDGKVKEISATRISDKVSAEENAADTTSNKKEWTDTRTIQYQLTFGNEELANNDNDFSIIAFVEDEAGKSSEKSEEETFTVDMVAPKVTVAYDNNAPHNSRYFEIVRTMTIIYTERNFAEERATFDISVYNGNTEKTFDDVTLKSLLDPNGTKIDGITVKKSETEKQTYTISFGEGNADYDFTIVPSVLDKAANSNIDESSNNVIVEYAKGTVCENVFTVDMAEPTMNIQYLEIANDGKATDITEKINTSDDEQKWYYTNKTIKAVVTITERNFALEKVFSNEPEQVVADYKQENVKDGTATTKHVKNASTLENWSKSEDEVYTYTQTFEFAGEANYKWNLTYTDLAGNDTSLLDKGETDKFVVDKTAPTGTITVKELSKEENAILRTFKEILEKISFGLYSNDGFKITFESEDITSIYNQSYFMYATDTDMNGEQEQLKITGDTASETTLEGIVRSAWIESIEGYGTNEAVKVQEVTVAENTQQIPYMRLEDKAGNVSFISSEGVIDDRQVPNGPEITIDVAEPTYAIYKDDVPFTITVTDPTTNGTYAGLESITFEIINNVKTVEDGLVKTTPTTTQSGDYVDFNAQLTDKTARVQSVTWSSSEDERLIIDSEKNNSNYVTIKVTATDYAGNVSVKTKDVMIDITKPELEIVYDNSTPVNEKYYNHTKKAKITYTERNFNENLATFAISVNGEKQTVSLADLMAGKVDGIVVSSYPTELIGFPMDESTYEYELIFGTDGFEYDFEITPSVTDMALNGNEIKAETAIFTVDMVTPEIEIQYVDENNVPITSINTDTDEQNWYYTNKTVKAIVTITERNFALPEETFSEEPKQVEVDYKKTYVKPQTALTDYVTDAETLTKWNLSKDDIYSQTFVFAGEANYEFNLTYTDLAGNTISLLEDETYKFVVDKTAPTGTIKVKELGTQGTTSIFDKLLSMISFGLYHNEGFEITFESDDITSIYKQSYFMYATEDDMHGEQAQLTVTGAAATEKTLTGIALQSWIGEDAYARNPKMQTFKTVENTQQIPYMRLEDKAGNVAFISAEGVIDDRSNPEAPQITIDLEAPDHGIYEEKDGVPFTITVTDPTVNGTYAGLKSVSYEILKDGVVTQSGNYDAELANKKGRTQTITHQEVIDTTKNNSNDVKIVVNALDYAGNTSTMTKEVMIDITEPTIHVEFNNDADVENGKYFNTDRVMTITITERNMETGSTADGMTFDVKAGVGIGTQDYDTDITLSELKAHYGIDYKWVSDSEAGTDVLKLSDARKSVLVLTFDKDNEYYIVPHCKDLGDNTESSLTYANDTAYAKEFVIDKTAPVIEVSYSLENVTSNNDQRAYSNQTVTAKVSITEQNFWLEGTAFSKEPLQWNFDKTLGTEMAETINDYQAEANDVKQWSRNVIISQKIFEFAKDANYTFGFTYTDLAGNVAVYEPHYFTVDKTLPEGTISIDGKSVWNNFWQMISFNIFKDDTYEMVMTSKDATAGVASTSYYKAEKPLTEAEVKDLASDAWVVLNPNDMRFTVSPDEQFVVYGRIIDRSGNVRFIYPTNGAVADATKPTITVTNLTTARNEIHNTDVTFHVEVKDPTSGNTYSGLEKVWYTIQATGNVSEADEVVLVDNSANKVQSNQEWSGEFTVSSQRFNSNNIEIQVHATDFTGNTYSTEIIPLKIDITEPTINITYDLNAPANEKYYKDIRTAVITVTERNFDPDGVRINITNTDGVQPTVSEWSKGTGTGVLDETINTCTVTFAADGDYTFAFDCTDLSGNVSQVVQTEEFTVDRTVPTIEVGYDNNNAMNDFYYATPRTATVTVTEHNFNGSEVQAAINATLEAQGISAPGVNGWHTSGDTHSATILFDRDGDYGFTLNYGDLAGNPATEFVASEFTIDQTKPVIEITDIEDRSANNGEVRPAISYSDVNYDEQNVTITIKGVKHTEASVDGTRTMIHNGQNIKLDDFAYEEAADDVYTLTASVVDRAGNSEEQSVLFSVNRFGSTYMFSESTAEFLDKYYVNEEQDLVVTEINVDRLERRDVSYGRDGELVNLEEGVHYSVEESGNDVSWKSFEYTISAENFEQEGLYNVTIDSKDQATNEVNNKIKNADISFVIDKTSPSVVITGIENEQYTENTRDITLNIADNVAMANVDIHVNDKVVNFDSEVIQEQQGVLSYTLESSDDWQEVYAVATDAAGNSATSDEYRVLISANLFVQILNNPVLLGAIGTVAVGGAGGSYFLFKRRKKAAK